MEIKIRLYARLREIVGKPEITLRVNIESTLKEVLEELLLKHPQLKSELMMEKRFELRPYYMLEINGESIPSGSDLKLRIQNGTRMQVFPTVFGG